MLTDDYLKLKEIFSPAALWEIKPKRIPGTVVHILQNGKTGFIEPLIEIHYPDGEQMESVYSGELEEFSEGDKVIFSLRDAKKIDGKNSHLQNAYDVKFALGENIDNLSYEFDPTKVAILGHKLEELRVDLERQNKILQQSIDEKIAEQLKLRIQQLDQQEQKIKERVSQIQSEEVDLKEHETRIEQIVAEKVAEKKLELDKFEAQLKSYVKIIEEADTASKQQRQEIEGERKQLASAIAKFQEEGGDKFVRVLAMMEEDGYPQSIARAPLTDENPPKDLLNKINKEFSKNNYIIDPAVSMQFFLSALTAVVTGQFVVLSGPTGVGKTSMVNAFASTLGAGAGVVPVRPSWIDPTDLLGFYNPQQQRFQPSPFMDLFLDARKYSEANRLFFLTLDEMNLGRVENYAADFLSRLEKARAGENGVFLQLYSTEIEQQLRLTVKRMKENRNDGFESAVALQNHLLKYRANIAIPEGLVMFGTVNLDNTAHPLSPKFLDRSFVINVPVQELVDQINKFSNTSSHSKAIFEISLNTVKGLVNGKGNLPPEAQKIWEDLLGWQEDYIQPLGIRLGFRFSQMYVNFMQIAAKLNVAPRAAASVFFQSKLLPWISFHQDERSVGDESQTKLEVLGNWAEDTSLADYPEEYGLQSALQKVVESGANSVVVRYLE